MKLIVGLGNPGSTYDKTRHNAGFMVLDELARRHARSTSAKGRFQALTIETTIADHRVMLIKPITYMNRSGQSFAEAVRFYKLDPATDALVVVDDLALACGRIRLRAEGTSGGHNGLADIERALGSTRYPRLRVGIDPKPAFMVQSDYVLGRFTPEQWSLVEPALAQAADACEAFVAKGLAQAMNRYNAPDQPTTKPTGAGRDPAQTDGGARRPEPAQPQSVERPEKDHSAGTGHVEP